MKGCIVSCFKVVHAVSLVTLHCILMPISAIRFTFSTVYVYI